MCIEGESRMSASKKVRKLESRQENYGCGLKVEKEGVPIGAVMSERI